MTEDHWYPAIWLAPESAFGIFLEPPTSCTERALRKGFWPDILLYGADGLLRQVVAAVPSAPVTILDRIFNRRIPIHLEHTSGRTATVAEVAGLLCGVVDKDQTDLYDQWMTRDELKAYFRSASSVAELIRHVSDLGAERDLGSTPA